MSRINSVLLFVVLSIYIKTQNADFVIKYSNFDDAFVSDAIIAASYLLKESKGTISLKEALKTFQENKISLNLPYCNERKRMMVDLKCNTDSKCVERRETFEECLERVKLNRLQLSYIFFKALRLKGGITTRIFGVIPKYAYNELVYLGFFRGGFAGQFVTKIEVLNTLADAIGYLEKISGRKDGGKK